MGIYLGQLPPAEVARFKAELAETLVANFCYPRFFDYRTESLHMRPVGRAQTSGRSGFTLVRSILRHGAA